MKKGRDIFRKDEEKEKEVSCVMDRQQRGSGRVTELRTDLQCLDRWCEVEACRVPLTRPYPTYTCPNPA